MQPLNPHTRQNGSPKLSCVFFQALNAEVESLQAFSGERDRVNAQLAALEAANAELKDQQEIRVRGIR